MAQIDELRELFDRQLGQEEGCNIPDEEEGVADEPEDPICFMGALSRGPSVDIGAEFEIDPILQDTVPELADDGNVNP